MNELYSYSSHKTWIRNPERCTALYFAADSGCIEVCQLLIEAKSDVNATDLRNYETALHVAIRNGHTQLCQLLIEAKADVNMSNI